MKLITNYAKDARKKLVVDILDDKMFEDDDSIEEVVKMLNEFIRLKTNNNMWQKSRKSSTPSILPPIVQGNNVMISEHIARQNTKSFP